ncbi:MAG: HAD-IB family hydrolase [Anaerolineales bacterium]|nr:MAG: HAD-IB family hydrolase [Anaerolineales bacterium]
MIIAIFDLDGTLYTGHITRGLARHHLTHRVKRMWVYFYLGTHMPIWWLSRAGLMSEAAMRELWSRHIGWMVRGWTPPEATRAFAWVAEQYVKPRVRSDVMARLQSHQDSGHRVILVSGTMAPLLEQIGRQLGVSETVGTPLVVRNGRYNGVSQLPVCQGRHKVTRLEAHLGGGEQNFWPQSYAYADSYTDLPLLERVGHPVAVFPDDKLAAHAKVHGWEVIN